MAHDHRRQTALVSPLRRGQAAPGSTPEVPAGTYMWVEHALVDGRFQSIYACLQHIAVFIDFSDDGEIDPCELSCTEAESHRAHNALNC